MLKARIIPCLDVKAGRVVKGVRFGDLRDAGEPAERAALYEAQGADEIVLLDISATSEGRGSALSTVARVRAVLGIPLTVGGGVRSVQDAARLLEAGADKVSLNTAALADASLVDAIAGQYGSQCAVVAVDALRTGSTYEVVARGGRERTGRRVEAWVREVEARGAGEVLLTSWDRDGTRSGYELPLLACVRAACDLPLVASGGAAGPGDLAEALAAGADAVLAASIFHDGDTTVADVKRELAQRGLEVRT